MSIVWIALLIELAVGHLIYFLAPSPAVLTAVIGLNIAVMLLTIASRPRRLALPLLVGFALRMALAAFDSSTLILSRTNGDTLGYFNNAMEWMAGTPVNRYGLLYSRLLGYIFRFCGGSRFFAEYINVLLGMTTVWTAYRCMALLDVGEKRRVLLLWVMAVFPYAIFSSAVTYREAVIGTFAALSCYFAVRWYLNKGYLQLLLCVASLLFAASFHGGIIFIGAGYIFLFTFYSHETRRLHFNRRTLPIAIIMLLGIGVALVFSNVFLTKFVNLTEERAINQFNFAFGGSAYLGWMDADSLGQMILFSPLKLIHFLFSPLPHYWRNIVDAITFAADGMFYFWCICQAIRHRKTTRYPQFVLAMGIGLFCCSFVFGIATWTAGTAVRHRQKMFACFMVMAAAAGVPRQEKLTSEENDENIQRDRTCL